MKVVGLMRVRNEEDIIQDTLIHLSEFCQEIYVYDDCSEDNTLDILRTHPKVFEIIENRKWSQERSAFKQGTQRQAILDLAKKRTYADWFIYMDCDERFEERFNHDFPKLLRNPDIDVYVLSLFDFYITPEDINKSYYEREWVGLEFRKIPFLFRNIDGIYFKRGGERLVRGFIKERVCFSDYKVKHYGFATSLKDFERKKEFYTNVMLLKNKWRRRQEGVRKDHTSFWGTPLIKWDDLIKKDWVINPGVINPSKYEYRCLNEGDYLDGSDFYKKQYDKNS